jgi:hypothetical protein
MGEKGDTETACYVLGQGFFQVLLFESNVSVQNDVMG